MTDRTCVNCKFAAEQKSQLVNVKMYECHRLPPHVQLIIGPGGQGQNVTMFPIVNDKMWCGEFEQAASKLN